MTLRNPRISGFVTLDTDDRGVATLRLDRPEKHNALSGTMIGELTAAAEEIASDDRIRVVVLAAAGRSFCAGADLGWMREQMSADRENRLLEATRLSTMFQVLDALPKPVIGRIQGPAYGGGIGLVCICDVAIAATGCRFGLTETRLGLVPAVIGPFVVARLGVGNARRFFMSPRVVGSEEAKDLGLLSRVTPEKDLDAALAEEIEPNLSVAPGAAATAKSLVKRLGRSATDSDVRHTVEVLADTLQGEEAQQGVEAFFSGRPPPWQV
ncbi:MAG: crotonase/enoyl-CoA hydratase family protein [Paracoccaceae bacterium]|nr:crotonase/enoyl-CoA hydratase family protein [Paracoccaceae bacterium]